jgi:hypothetical protein
MRFAAADDSASGFEATIFKTTAATTAFAFRTRVAGGSRASPAATPDNIILQSFNVGGHNGTSWVTQQFTYQIVSDGLWSGTNYGTFCRWSGTPNGSTSLAEWMRLQGGLLGIGASPTAGNGLLQLASGTTKANGIAFGTDAFLYRSAAGEIKNDGRNLEAGCFAEIHVHDASTAQSIANGTTYTKSTAFTNNGPAVNCTADATNDKITLTKTGYYRVECSISFTTGTNSIVMKAAAFLGGTEQDNCHCQRKIGTGSDVGNMGFTGIIDNTSANTDLDLRFAHSDGSAVDLTVIYANLNVSYLGET